ncbi:ABC-2 type transport system permease protein [Salinibacterium sp. CAN_S4]|uniref:ABC transporter permease n=1 Tax=Salinibacterium sp. CAN_S4 TaxID=2787727 RepID=UPI0018EFD437
MSTTPATKSNYQSPGALQATWLVASREVSMKLRSKSFVISTAITILAILAAVVIGGIVGANPPQTSVAVVGSAAQAVEDAGGFAITEAATIDAAEDLVRSGDVEAAVVPDPGATGIRVIGLDSTPGAVIAALSVAPEITVLEPSGQNEGILYLVALGFGLVFFMSAITFGLTIAQSVVEEKQTRIVEILMSTVPVQVLLAGKIVGNSILAFGQIILIALVAGVGLLATGQDILLADVGPSLVWFVVLFVFGFVLLSSLFAAAAALVSRQEDMGTVTSPIMMLVMAPYFLVILFFDNPVVLGIMSYVPFSAPVGMPMRIFLGTAEWWEPVLSLGILVAATVGFVALGSRIYANGLLRMGPRMKLSEALKG